MAADKGYQTDEERDAFWKESFRIQKAGTKYKNFIPVQRYKLTGGTLVPGMIAVVQAVEMFWVESEKRNRWRKRKGEKPRAYTVVSYDAARQLMIGTPLDRWAAPKKKES